MTLRGALAARGQIGGPLATAAGGAAAGPWWNPDGATPAANCGAWQAKGAASLAASYLNLATLGYANIDPAIVGGVAPGWAAGTGWIFNAAISTYLKTDLFPTPSVGSALIQFTAFAGGAANTLFGIYDDAAPVGYALIQSAGAVIRTYHGGLVSFVDNAPMLAAGNLGYAGYTPYRDGVAEPNTVAPSPAAAPNTAIYIGALNYNNVPLQHVSVSVVAFAYYDVVLSAPQFLARATAMAAL